MSYARSTVLHDSQFWKLESFGNGDAYALTNKQADLAYSCQGEEATDFAKLYDSYETTYPDAVRDDVLKNLWHDSELALVADRPKLP